MPNNNETHYQILFVPKITWTQYEILPISNCIKTQYQIVLNQTQGQILKVLMATLYPSTTHCPIVIVCKSLKLLKPPELSMSTKTTAPSMTQLKPAFNDPPSPCSKHPGPFPRVSTQLHNHAVATLGTCNARRAPIWAILHRAMAAFRAVVEANWTGIDDQCADQTTLQGLAKLVSPAYHKLAAAHIGLVTTHTLHVSTLSGPCSLPILQPFFWAPTPKIVRYLHCQCRGCNKLGIGLLHRPRILQLSPLL